MSKVLTVKNFKAVQDLINNQTTSLETTFVDRSLVTGEEDAPVEIVPVVTLYSVTPDNTKLQVIQYVYPAVVENQTEDDKPTPGGSRVTFLESTSFDNRVFIADTAVASIEDGDSGFETGYMFKQEDLNTTALNYAKRAVDSQLGINLDDLENGKYQIQVIYFMGNQDLQENRGRAGVGVLIKLDNVTFHEMTKSFDTNPENILEVGVLGLNLDALVEGMNVTPAIRETVSKLMNEHGLDAWGCQLVDYICHTTINDILKNITYGDLVQLSNAKAATEAIKAHEAEQTPVETEAPVQAVEATVEDADKAV